MVNYYHILGLTEGASASEIKTAFKKLAVIYHPDKNPGNPEMEEQFKKINHAHQVLSNPYEKARYDIQLRYGQVRQESYYEQPTTSHPENPRTRTYRPAYDEPEIDWKENWIATAYAFGFTLIVAIIVMAAIGIKNYFDEKQYQELLMRRRDSFEKVKTLYAKGEIDLALQILNEMGAFLGPEGDMAQYKKDLIETLISKGEFNYYHGQYDDAIFYFELVENYAASQPLALREHLALSYRITNQPYKSIEKIKELFIADYRPLSLYVELAEIHRDQLHDADEARRYFEMASNKAIEQYKAIYGEAYPLVLKENLLPPLHYRLYTGLAQMYLITGDPEKAIKATRWNIKIWPDSMLNYVISARGFQKLNNREKACEYYHLAQAKGYRGSIPVHYCAHTDPG